MATTTAQLDEPTQPLKLIIEGQPFTAIIRGVPKPKLLLEGERVMTTSQAQAEAAKVSGDTIGGWNVDHAARARRESDQFRELNEEMVKRLTGVRALLGDTVHDALQRPFELLVDTAIDVHTSYERALRAGADALSKATADATARIFELQGDRMSDERAWVKQTGRLQELLRLATDDVADRYKRSRKPLPAWFDDARFSIDPPF